MARLNPALGRGLDILEALVETPEAPTLRDLVERLGIPRTTAFELTNTLVARGYLSKSEGEPVTFTLGPRSFQLGSAFADRLDYVALGRIAASALSSRSDETSHVAILDGTHVVYIARAESTQQVRMVSSIGSRLPAHATSVGKALIAQLSSAEFDRRFPRGEPLSRLTPNTVTDVDSLREQCVRIRAQGYAIEECESNLDVCCAAAPVRSQVGDVVAAISVSVPENRWTVHPPEHWGELVLESAASYSASLGHVPR